MMLPYDSFATRAVSAASTKVQTSATSQPTAPDTNPTLDTVSVVLAALAITVSCVFALLQMWAARNGNVHLRQLIQGVDDIRRRL